MGGILIPKVLMNKKRVKAQTPSHSSKSSSKQTKPYVSLVELGIPLDLNFFKQSILHSSGGKFDTIAWTTLDDVRREFFNINTKNQFSKKRTFIEAKNFVKKLKLNSVKEWRDYCNGILTNLPAKPEDIPTNVYSSYKDEGFTNLMDFLGLDLGKSRNRKFKSFNEVKSFFKKNKIFSQSDWKQFCKDGKRPLDIPYSVVSYYKETNKFINWGSFTGNEAPQNKIFREFSKAREYARSLKLKSGNDWRRFSESDKRPNDIPASPANIKQYQPHWKGMKNWLGIK
jgi:hypothetical protein